MLYVCDVSIKLINSHLRKCCFDISGCSLESLTLSSVVSKIPEFLEGSREENRKPYYAALEPHRECMAVEPHSSSHSISERWYQKWRDER